MAKPLRLRAPFLRVSIGALAPCNNPDACRITLVECLVGSALPPSKHACSAWQDALLQVRPLLADRSRSSSERLVNLRRRDSTASSKNHCVSLATSSRSLSIVMM